MTAAPIGSVAGHFSPKKMKLRVCKFVFLALGFVVFLFSHRWVNAQHENLRPLPPTPIAAFRPSNAQTTDGHLIPVQQFFPAARCQSCHQDTHAAWSQSLHRNAAREPFYRESADILLKTRGIEFTRHCESCHTPVALFSGALTKDAPKQTAPFTPLDDEGINCSVCHSITEARLDGTGSYTLRRPALLAAADGTPLYEINQQPITDEQILADIPGHKRAVMRPLLKQPEFCATCHKVDAPPDLNGYKHIKGFSAYDEWQQSGASHEAIQSFYPRAERADCRTCHMPKVESRNDRAAKFRVSSLESRGNTLETQNAKRETKVIASHRWLGANTAAPQFYGQAEQVKATTQFLQANVLEIDIFALTATGTNQSVAALTPEMSYTFAPGSEVTAEVVVSNRQAAHSFPPEVRDLYEAWVEFEAVDAQGKTLFHSGFIQPNGQLDESAHVYKNIILDEQGRAITRHQIWTTNIKAYDNTIGPGRSDVVRFRFRIPENAAAGAAMPLPRNGQRSSWLPPTKSQPTTRVTLKAKVNYRRFNQEYTDYVLRRQKRQMTVPIVKMAETRAVIGGRWSVVGNGKAEVSTRNAELETHRQPPTANRPLTTNSSPITEAKRWNDYGIGLLEQAQYGFAAAAFRKAAELAPDDPNYLVNAAIAEYRTERFAPEREQLHKAEALLTRALQFPATAFGNPLSFARAQYWQAAVLRANHQRPAAADIFQQLARAYPRDREVQRQLGQTLYTLGQLTGARTAFAAVLGLDPTDANAWQMLAPLYASEGRQPESEQAHTQYLRWRDDPMAEGIAAQFYRAHPEWADERNGAHVHGAKSTLRPILTGGMATPEK